MNPVVNHHRTVVVQLADKWCWEGRTLGFHQKVTFIYKCAGANNLNIWIFSFKIGNSLPKCSEEN
jgi:hypothetical protein